MCAGSPAYANDGAGEVRENGCVWVCVLLCLCLCPASGTKEETNKGGDKTTYSRHTQKIARV